MGRILMMAESTKKRTLDAFFKPPPKKVKVSEAEHQEELSTESQDPDVKEQVDFCLVNYYASGSDSISYHSDDEKFLGALPAIASFSLGAKRDFLMKHKPIAPNDNAPPPPETKPIKLPLASGDMILMKG